MASPRMGRPATGYILWNDCACGASVDSSGVCATCGKESTPLSVRVTTGEGKRKFIPFDPGTSAALARDLAPVMAAKAKRAVSENSSETVSEWAIRWLDSRDEKGLSSVRQDRGRFKKWIEPRIGTKPIGEVKRRDLEELVQHLDTEVRKHTKAKFKRGIGLKWKTAINVWGCATKMFADACRSKVLDLRVREDNPARDVEGPDRGAERMARICSRTNSMR